MHIVGYDTPDGPKCESDAREWVLGFLDIQDSEELTTADLITRGMAAHPEHVYDVKGVYVTDLACSLCEHGEDHNPDAGECVDEYCEDCGTTL